MSEIFYEHFRDLMWTEKTKDVTKAWNAFEKSYNDKLLNRHEYGILVDLAHRLFEVFKDIERGKDEV